MRRRRSYKELELENKLLQDTLASTEKDLAHYKERVRVLEAYVSRTTKEIRNLTQDFQMYEFTSSGILCTNHINCRDQLCVNLDTGELILPNY